MSTTETESPTPTPAASETDPSSTGAVEPGSSGGSQDAPDGGDPFAAERASFEERLRTLQSDRDRARAELAKVQKPAASEGAAPSLTAESVAEIVARVAGQERTANQLRQSEEFKHADPSIFDRAHEFSSPEELRVAAAESHAARKALFDAGFQAGQKAEPPAPPDPGPAGSSSGTPSSGLPTQAQLMEGGLHALEALRRQFPEGKQGDYEYEQALDKIASS